MEVKFRPTYPIVSSSGSKVNSLGLAGNSISLAVMVRQYSSSAGVVSIIISSDGAFTSLFTSGPANANITGKSTKPLAIPNPIIPSHILKKD